MAFEPGQDVYHTVGVMGEATDACEQLNALKDDEKKQTSFSESERQLLIELRGWVDGYMSAMDSLQRDPSNRVANVHITDRFERVIDRCRQYPWESVASATEAARRLLINEPVQSNEALSAGHPPPAPPPGWLRPTGAR